MIKMTPITLALARIARWWTVLVVFLLNFASLQLLFWFENRFTTLTGFPVFDTQNELTADQIMSQLPLYMGEARTAYLWFAVYDFVFPLIAALALALLWAWLLRTMTWQIGAMATHWNLPMLPFLATLADWGENIALLSVILGNQGTQAGAISAALLFKQLKLTMLTVTGVVSITLILLATLNNGWNLLERFRPKLQA
jgi:hypothetical protein